MPVHDFHDVREYIEKIDKMGLLTRIDGADCNLEIGALSDIYCGQKAILFDNIKGYPKGYRILSNFLTHINHLKLITGAPMELERLELVKYEKARLHQFQSVPPRLVKSGPILENVLTGDKVDLLRFPAPKWHELDGGRYLGTGDLVITKDPDEGWVNLGTYRVMVHDKATAGSYISPGKHGRIMREKYWSQGKSCPVAVVCGEDPSLFVPSAASMPWGVSEYEYAGWLKGEPIEVVSGPATGLPIPARAEVVLEGEIPPPDVESRTEGPFAEWPGYYGSGAREEPVIRVKSICFRSDPIIMGDSPGNVPATVRMHYYRSAILWDELEKSGVPEIRGVWKMEIGASWFVTAVSIKQRYAGHARHAGLAAAGCREGAYANHFVIVVDDDIDPCNEDDVWWAVATRCDPATDIEIIRDSWSTPLDPRIEPEKRRKGDFTISKAIIYAVRPYHWMKEFSPVCRFTEEYLAKILEKFKDQTADLPKGRLHELVSAKVHRLI